MSIECRVKRLVKIAVLKASRIKRGVLGWVKARIRRTSILLTIAFGVLAVYGLLFKTTAWQWLPHADSARSLLATLLTAQAAIAALTLAVTLFVMQGVSTRRDADDRMYHEYIRQSRVRPIFWGSVAAVGFTGVALLAQEFSIGSDWIEDNVTGLANFTLVAGISFFANLALSCALFERALRLGHPERWSTLRRRVNERDVRASVQAFLSRHRRAADSLATNDADWSTLLPNQSEGSANEAIRALLDDARLVITESRFREFKLSIESVRGLIENAMDEIEREGISWE